MGAKAAPRIAAASLMRRFLWTVAAGTLGQSGAAVAFPLVDPTNVGSLAGASDLAGPDAQDLTHQLQIANGLPGLASAGGWTFVPRLGFQESLTDNVMQVHSPMRWDLTTAFSPGITIAGNTQRAQVRLDYAPVLIMNARTGSQNALNQQLNGTATVTAISDLAFVDLRALAGVQSTRGAAGGYGTIGAGDAGGLTAGSMSGFGATTGVGANKENTVQTTSVSISPYLLHKFGDYGTAKLGYSLNLSQNSPTTGVQFLPFPAGGGNSQKLMTTEQTVEFKSGDFLNDFQDTLDVDMSQSTSTNQIGSITTFGTVATAPTSLRSSRQIVTNALNYALNRKVTLTVSIGHENIVYTGSNATSINDMTWSFGGTYNPNQNSSITVSYGHLQGADALSFSGHYQLTARTAITGSYSDTLGTQLENLQRQLNQGVVGANGSLVNAQTGGQLFGSTNATPIQPGVFHFKTLTATATTQLNRDTLSLTLNMSNQVSTGGSSVTLGSSQTNGIIMQWTHDLRPDLRLSTSASYNILTGGIGGGSQSIAFNSSLIYTISETLSASARYSFFKSTSSSALLSLYEDILVVGITKLF